MLKRVFLVIGLLLLAVVLFLLWNTFTTKSIQPTGEVLQPISVDGEAVAKRLSKAVQFQTISAPDYFQDSIFIAFQNFIKTSYPEVFSNLNLQIIGNHSMLLLWNGTDKSLKPALFLAHQDVVPVEEATIEMWQEEPFGGTIKEGIIWGRGSLDDKSSMLGLLEAATLLLQNSFVPARDTYFLFGEDEEVLGTKGAKNAAKYFKEHDITFEMISDEGTLLTQNIVPGIDKKPVALIGISEKGYLSVELTCTIAGGHSSMPADDNAVNVLANALVNLSKKPFPNKFCEPVNGFIEYMGPEMPFVQRLAFSNVFLLKDLIFNAYEKSNSGKAMIHTTMTPTIVKAGVKENVVPTQAKATLNLRLLPGETIESAVKHITESIADERIEIVVLEGAANPSAVSNYKTEAFLQLGLAVKDVYNDALITPFLMLAATDSRHFEGLSDNIYKFMPVLFESEDLARFHGVNERISIENYKKAIQIYGQCIVRWCGTTE